MNSAAPAPIRDVVILRIAEGGMGYIDLVARRQGRFSRLFARKRLHPYLRGDPTFRAMFLDEARLAGLIRHPNVAAALEVGEDAEGPFLLMDYVDGPSVAEILERFRPRESLLPVAFCVAVAAQAARGLHAAHELASAQGTLLGVVHRDISPKNLLVGYDGLVRVADFGIAKANDNLEQTRVGVLKGNVGYMAPEYLRFQDLDGRSDLFALGIVLYEMLTRERLYDGEDTAAIARRILDEPAPDIFERRDVPPELAALLFDLMAKDRAARPASALVAAARLDQIAGDMAAADGAFDLAAFLEAELAPMREERRALVDAALTVAASDSGPVAAEPAAAAGGLTPPPLAAGAPVLAALSPSSSGARTTVGGSRRRWRRRTPILAALLAVALFVVVWPSHRPPDRAPVVAFAPGAGALWGGGWHTCAQRGRQLVCWGSNIRGQLGDGTQDSHATPVVAPIAEVRGVALGEYHTCVVTREGRVSCWGRNIRGELGRPSPTLSKVPLEVPGLDGVRAIAAGRQHTCALRTGGAVVCWGANESGQLGRAPSAEDQRPAPIPELPPVDRIFAGGSNSCATVTDGSLLCWGADESGQLGDGKHDARAAALPVPGAAGIVSLGICNAARAGSKNPDLSKNAGFMCGVRARDGAVLCWGNNGTAQLGDGTREDRPTPTPVPGINDAIQVDVGDLHACALRRSGRVSCWGRNEFGAVGDGSMGPSTIRLTPVDARAIEDAVGIALGDAHSCARRRTGAILCWGVNNFGQLGDGSNLLRPAPYPTSGLP
jgi:alpha-tubulin suppressor-like RCC1 family protein/tRNA A-37 threonylcarbamoyl transferase component Bud32